MIVHWFDSHVVGHLLQEVKLSYTSMHTLYEQGCFDHEKSNATTHDTGFEMLVLDGEMRLGVLNRGHSGSGISWE
jgi:hypothetical protein